MKSANDETLESAISSCERWERFCGLLVVLGLALEFLVAVDNPVYGTALERWGGVICDAFVALGVIGEIAFAARAGVCQGEITQRSNGRLKDAFDMAFAANERARDASGQAFSASVDAENAQTALAEAQADLAAAMGMASAANGRAAILEKEAAEARERTAQLEQLTAWRRVLPRQREQIVSIAREFADEIDLLIEVQPHDAEALTYSRGMYEAFVSAGVTKIRVSTNSYTSGLVFGVKEWSSIEPMSLALRAAFHPWIERIEIEFSSRMPPLEPAPNVYIFVAPRPAPDIAWDATDPQDADATKSDSAAT